MFTHRGADGGQCPPGIAPDADCSRFGRTSAPLRLSASVSLAPSVRLRVRPPSPPSEGSCWPSARTSSSTSRSSLNFNSILVVGYAFIGGIGYLLGPISGATLHPAPSDQALTRDLLGPRPLDPPHRWCDVVLFVLQNQDGITHEQMNFVDLFRQSALERTSRAAPGDRARSSCLPTSARSGAGATARPSKSKSLTVRYGGVIAVSDVSFSVRPGQIVGLIGPNGAGKTSAIDAITGFTRAATGNVLLDGSDSLDSRHRRARARAVPLVPVPRLFEDSLCSTTCAPHPTPVTGWSYFVDLVNPKAPPLPGPRSWPRSASSGSRRPPRQVQDLPYGQRRLLAIARAVAMQPSVLLLDEPAAGLGDAETAELAHLVRRLADDWGIAVLLVEHDMNFVMSVCDDIVVLDFGARSARGPRRRFEATPGDRRLPRRRGQHTTRLM